MKASILILFLAALLQSVQADQFKVH